MAIRRSNDIKNGLIGHKALLYSIGSIMSEKYRVSDAQLHLGPVIQFGKSDLFSIAKYRYIDSFE